MGSGIHKTTIKNIAKILEVLRKHDTIHLRGICKVLDLNPFIVSNIIDKYLDYFVDIRGIDQFGFRVKMISLKRDKLDTTVEDVINYIEIKRKIRSSV